MLWVKQSEGAHTMKTLGGHMLQKATQEFVHGQSHGLALSVPAITVSEGDAVLVGAEQRFLGERGAVHVASQVLEHALGAVHHRFGEYDPGLGPNALGYRDSWENASRELEELPAKALCQCLDGNNEGFATTRD
jgi:hypothetical protein